MKKVIEGVDDLVTTNPKILEEWNYKRNSILPTTISEGSSKKVWWICKKCSTEWEATPKNRIKGGTGCPKCGLEKIGKNHNKTIIEKRGNLFNKRPDLVEEWDYNKNFPLTPKDVSVGSGKKVWWKCKKGHEWEARICNRTAGSNCIYCTKQKTLVGVNDITVTNPDLIEEWDYEKNKGLSPQNYMAGSNKKVWWKCPLGHSWQATISKRTDGTGCPKCYSENGTSFPEQAICYYLSKVTKIKNREKINNQEIDIFLPDYNIGFEYDGAYYHQGKRNKIKEEKKNKTIEKNNILLYRIKESSEDFFDEKKKIIFCIADRDYKYIKNVLNYIAKILNIEIGNIDIKNDRSAIYSQYIISVKKNNFTVYYPELLKEWDYERNKGVFPESFQVNSNKKVWWKCLTCDSSYEASIFHKTEGTSCPYCSGKKVNTTNNLKVKYPNLIKMWDYEKNSILPEDVYFRSRIKIWWKCSNCGQSFLTPVCSRIRAKTSYCPNCMHQHIGNVNRKKSVKQNRSLFNAHPLLLKEWNYEKNNDITPKDLTAGSGKIIWWKCSKCHYEWKAQVWNRTHGTGCPNCQFNIQENKYNAKNQNSIRNNKLFL